MCIKQVLDSFGRKIEKKTLATSLSITSEKLPNNEFSMQKLEQSILICKVPYKKGNLTLKCFI